MISDFLYVLLKTIKSRIFIVGLITVGLFSVLIYRMFDLQIVNESYYMSTYIQKAEKTVYTPATRGKILDVNGEVLAYDQLSYTVTFEDKIDSSDEKNNQMNAITINAINIIEENGDSVIVDFPIFLNRDNKWEYSVTSDASKNLFLTNIFGKELKKDGRDYSNASAGEMISYLKDEFFQVKGDYDNELLLKILAIRYNVYCNSYQKYVPITIAKDVSQNTMVAIYENEADLTGITITEQNVRRYKDSYYFAPILGYTGKISDEELEMYNAESEKYISNDTVGKAGIEATMEEELQGVREEKKIFVDSTGKVLSTIEKKDSVAGNDVYLSIDSKLQKAAYKILEKKIAGILLSEIVNYDVDEENQTDENIHYIPVKRVYSQLVTNNVVDLNKLESGKSDNEKRLYRKYKSSLDTVISKLKSQLTDDEGIIYNDLSDEYEAYHDYIYELLKNDGILLTSAMNLEDATYLKYVEGEISSNEFIKHAIKSNWISLDSLEVSDSYLSTEETYSLIVKHITEDIKNNTSFGKIVIEYRIFDGTINGAEICMLLYDQNILEMDETLYNRLQAFDSYVTYKFITNQIKKLNITPAQLALDPCSGSVVITDPNNGKIRALVTYPSYDNNLFSGTVDSEYWAKLIDDDSDPLYNRATQGATAPGSTFKMVSAATVLEENITGTHDVVSCSGQFEKITPSPKCWIYPYAHGSENIMGAIGDSCNCYFYEMGYRLGTTKDNKYDSDLGLGKIEKYATQLGLNMLSGVEITEREPRFSTDSAVHSAIGQGSHAYTPVQLARYVSTVANGGNNYELSLIDKVASSSGKTISEKEPVLTNTVDFAESTWNSIHTGMIKVTTDGTVDDYFKDTDIKIAGKTGTAQENKKRNSHSLFVAYAPYSNPEIAVAAVIPFGNSSHDSAEIGKEVIQYYYGEITDKDINKAVKSNDTTSVTLD